MKNERKFYVQRMHASKVNKKKIMSQLLFIKVRFALLPAKK